MRLNTIDLIQTFLEEKKYIVNCSDYDSSTDFGTLRLGNISIIIKGNKIYISPDSCFSSIALSVFNVSSPDFLEKLEEEIRNNNAI